MIKDKKLFKEPKSMKILFDKHIKGYVVDTTSFSIGDENGKTNLSSHDNVVLQIYLTRDTNFKIEFTIGGEKAQKKRLLFSSSFKSLQNSFFHLRVPLDKLPVKVI